MSNRPPTGRRRFFKLASMTASVAGNYAKNKLSSVFTDAATNINKTSVTNQLNGELIAQTLGELKGAVMKMGQMASVAKDILPAELANALTALQQEAPPVSYEVIAEQIERELGASPEQLFSDFEREPFASASIGQVHRATTDDGQSVAVKVQYPGVDAAVDSDLAHLKFALSASGLIKVKRQALNAMFIELKKRLHEELDYCNEADNLRFFSKYYQNHPTVVIPVLIPERSSQRILTMRYEAGDPLESLEELGYSQALRNQIGVSLVEIMADQIFSLHRLHADPNPANFGFRQDGKIVFYDFGCTKTLPSKIVQAYRDTLRSALEEDYLGVEDGLIRCGARNLEGPEVPVSYYKMWRDIFMAPFYPDSYYDFGQANIHNEVLKHIPLFLAKYVSSFSPPPELIFVDRVVVGHYAILRKLEAQAHYRSLLDAALSMSKE